MYTKYIQLVLSMLYYACTKFTYIHEPSQNQLKINDTMATIDSHVRLTFAENYIVHQGLPENYPQWVGMGM